jgi:hypothetical protein
MMMEYERPRPANKGNQTMNTQILPTDKNGNTYYGPTTFKAAVSAIDDGAMPKTVAEMMAGAGYTGIAAKIRSEYGITPKIVLRVSVCPMSLQHGNEGDLIDGELLLTEIESAAAKRWPDCEIEFAALQIGHRQGEQFAKCWIDGVRDDEQVYALLESIDYSDERLYL